MKLFTKMLRDNRCDLACPQRAYAADHDHEIWPCRAHRAPCSRPSVDNFAGCVNGAMGDKVDVQTFGSSQLGKDKELLQKLKLGQVDFSLPSSVMSSVDDSSASSRCPTSSLTATTCAASRPP